MREMRAVLLFFASLVLLITGQVGCYNLYKSGAVSESYFVTYELGSAWLVLACSSINLLCVDQCRLRDRKKPVKLAVDELLV